MEEEEALDLVTSTQAQLHSIFKYSYIKLYTWLEFSNLPVCEYFCYNSTYLKNKEKELCSNLAIESVIKR